MSTMFTEPERPSCVTMYTKTEDIFWGKKIVREGKRNGVQGEERAEERRGGRERQTETERRGDMKIEAIRREKFFLRYGCFLIFLNTPLS